MSIIDDLMIVKQAEEPTPFSRFHKTKDGESSAGDLFLIVSTAHLNEIVKKYAGSLTLADMEILLQHPIHEVRTVAIACLVVQSRKVQGWDKKPFVDFYLNHLDRVNGWDLVDISAPDLLGEYLHQIQDFRLLDQLAGSDLLWARRVAIVSTLRLIRYGNLEPTFRITEKLLKDKEDLIHKACGWMLREAGKQNRGRLNQFLKEHYFELPRTTLRYAIERHEENERRQILKGIFQEE